MSEAPSVRSLRFADQVRGLDFDEAAYQRDLAAIAPAARAYVVVFTARSGSSWLTQVLTATGQLGHPEEYLNPNFVAGQARAYNAGRPMRLLQMLRRHRQTANGVFGIEVRHLDIEAFGLEPFRATFANQAVFFHLWREDIVAQAVSLYRAVATERFHSNSTTGSTQPPPYDADQIARWLAHVSGTENGNVRVLRTLGAAARHLRYEQIVQDRAGTVAGIAAALGVALAPESPATAALLEKLADDWNLDAAARFRRDRAELIATVEAQRLVRHGIAAPPRSPPDAAPLHAIWNQGHAAGQAGSSLWDPPALNDTQRRVWRDGWCEGWDDQPRLAAEPPPRARALAAGPTLPPDMPETEVKLGGRPPRPLADLTARLLVQMLLDQDRRGVPGGLVEIGLSRGRQTALLLQAAHRRGARVAGIDAPGSKLATPLADWLRRTRGPEAASWAVRGYLPADGAAAWLRNAIGGPARCVCLDAAQFSHPDEPPSIAALDALFALATNVLGDDACLVVSDFLMSSALRITDGVFRFLAATPAFRPFALLPGRLLIAPAAVAPRYTDMIKALALRDASDTGAGRLGAALRRGNISNLAQTLCGAEVLVLG